MKKEDGLKKLENLLEAISSDGLKDLDDLLKQEDIDPKLLVEKGIQKIETFKNNANKSLKSSRKDLINAAISKWKRLSDGINTKINEEIEPLLLNSNDEGLQLFFQSIEKIENQDELENDSAKMNQEIALFRLIENLKKNQS